MNEATVCRWLWYIPKKDVIASTKSADKKYHAGNQPMYFRFDYVRYEKIPPKGYRPEKWQITQHINRYYLRVFLPLRNEIQWYKLCPQFMAQLSKNQSQEFEHSYQRLLLRHGEAGGYLKKLLLLSQFLDGDVLGVIAGIAGRFKYEDRMNYYSKIKY